MNRKNSKGLNKQNYKRTFTVEIGGDIMPIPEIIKEKLIELNPDNINAEFAEKTSSGELFFTKIQNNK